MSTVSAWLECRRQQSGLVVTPIPLRECSAWSLVEGRLRHATSGFFSIIGCCCDDGPPHLAGLSLPMIDQPEIGILGFVVRLGDKGWEWLLQAKTEPGNVGGTQIGPSVQATYSNYMCVHGGKATEMIDMFTSGDGALRRVVDVEHSEQGDRFLGKYNRNMVVEVDTNYIVPTHGGWRWFPARELREALHLDFTVNTDARSVLACSDWALLTDPNEGLPFARWRGQGGYGERLWESATAGDGDVASTMAIARLAAIRQEVSLRVRPMSLEALPGWRLGKWGLAAAGLRAASVVQAYAISSNDREVHAWCQPLMKNTEDSRVVLACAQRDGILQFLLNPSVEPGFKEGAQFGPSLVTGIGHGALPGLAAAMDDPDAVVWARVMQSDEGGRFMHSIACYQIIELPDHRVDECAGLGTWVTLAALRNMTRGRGLLTNELRSVLSLLLKWV